jgi:hypothetical protein
MKTPLILIALLFSISVTSPAQQTVAEWQTKAIEAYPELGVPDSQLNKSFLQLHQQLKETNPQLFDNPKWPLLIAQLIAGDAKPATPSPPFFVVVTTAYQWPDGLASPAGEVERAIAIEGGSYVLWHPSGVRYKLPKSYAQVISDGDASVRLLAQRQQLYGQLQEVYNQQAGASQQQGQNVTLEQLQQIVDIYTRLQQMTNTQDQQSLEMIERLQALKSGRTRTRPKQTPEEANAWWQEYQRQQQLNQMRSEIDRLRQQQNR